MNFIYVNFISLILDFFQSQEKAYTSLWSRRLPTLEKALCAAAGLVPREAPHNRPMRQSVSLGIRLASGLLLILGTLGGKRKQRFMERYEKNQGGSNRLSRPWLWHHVYLLNDKTAVIPLWFIDDGRSKCFIVCKTLSVLDIAVFRL